MVFKIITSLVFIAVFIARIVKPEWNIDTTSIILLILAFYIEPTVIVPGIVSAMLPRSSIVSC